MAVLAWVVLQRDDLFSDELTSARAQLFGFWGKGEIHGLAVEKGMIIFNG
jgi:hypothetical protein